MSAPVDVLADACFACGKKLGKRGGFLVDTRDGQEVFIGPECFKNVQAAGDAGHQPPKGGPRLYPLSAAGVLADLARCAKSLGGEESEVLMQAREAVAELLEVHRNTGFELQSLVARHGLGMSREGLARRGALLESSLAALARCKGGAA